MCQFFNKSNKNLSCVLQSKHEVMQCARLRAQQHTTIMMKVFCMTSCTKHVFFFCARACYHDKSWCMMQFNQFPPSGLIGYSFMTFRPFLSRTHKGLLRAETEAHVLFRGEVVRVPPKSFPSMCCRNTETEETQHTYMTLNTVLWTSVNSVWSLKEFLELFLFQLSSGSDVAVLSALYCSLILKVWNKENILITKSWSYY